MELKYKTKRINKHFNNVLIVPLWNWNINFDFQSSSGASSFNRTFMELK